MEEILPWISDAAGVTAICLQKELIAEQAVALERYLNHGLATQEVR
jgi:hypothetical protein